MANYYGQTRSNYFAVKDAEAFTTELENYPVRVITQETKEGGKLYGFLDADDDGSGEIWSIYNNETDEYDEIDWGHVFKRHLQDDWVAVIITTGSEKYRYFTGDATAYNNKGESKTLNLEYIYQLGKDLGENITFASY
jgi:hypothetical protein